MISSKNIINMYFATHKTCNLHCKYCYVPEYNRFAKKVKDDDILSSLKRFIDKVNDEDYGIGSFCLHGSEASLMNPSTMGEIVVLMNSYWKDAGIEGYNVAIQTNGKRFTNDYLDDVLEKIEKPEKLRIGFSIDPPKQVHDKLRAGSFNSVTKNYYNAIERGFPTSVLSVVSNSTMNHLDEFGGFMQAQMKLNKQYGNPYKVKIKFATGDLTIDEQEINLFSDFLIAEDLLSLPQMFTPGYCIHEGNECMWFEFDIYGNCYSCNKVYNDDGIFASWHEEPFDKIFGKRKTLYRDVIRHADCNGCEFEYLCNSGCPVDRYKTGPMAGKAHECSMIKKVYKHIIENTDMHITEFYNKNN